MPRYQRGELSPQGYYLDSFDYPALRNTCLLPFLGGESALRTTTYDHRGGAQENITIAVPTRAVLIIGAVLLLRPQLRDLWTLSVYLRVCPKESLRRAHGRDLELFGSAEEIERRYLGRYLPGQALYRQLADPQRLAHPGGQRTQWRTSDQALVPARSHRSRLINAPDEVVSSFRLARTAGSP